MTNKYTLFLVLIFCYTLDITAQLRYTTVANSSTTTTFGSDHQLAISGSNVFIAFKRGTGSTTADREIKVARSNNNGVSFAETDITFSNNTNTYSPIVASTATSVVALYRYDTTGTSSARTCIARSTNNGMSFNLSSNSNSNLRYIVQYPSSFVADGTSKYFICDDDYIFGSLDNGVTFTQLNTPAGFNNAYEARLAATSTYLWVVFVKYTMDSIFVYRSSNNGTSYQLIAQYFADLPSSYLFGCEAISDQLHIAWVHEEVGTYTLRLRTITGTTVGTVQDIATSNSSSTFGYNPLQVRKTTNTMWVKASDRVYRSISGGPWSRGSKVTTEITGYPSLHTYFAFNDSTLYLSLNRSSTGSLREYLFGNVKWTDFPIPRLPNDTLITRNSGVRINFDPYISTPVYRLQLSRSPDFATLDLDTTYIYNWFYFQMRGRFPANGTRYYYRIRGEDASYSTSWSPTRSFRFGAVITTAPTLLSPPNGSSFVYPASVPFQWSAVIEATWYYLHVSANDAFSDTVWFYTLPSTQWSIFMPRNGTLYWRVKGIEYESGSVGPWSSTGYFNYSGVPTSVPIHMSQVPTNFQLSQNFPNPFNPVTTIRYEVPKQASIELSIFNTLGQVVVTLVQGTHNPGYYSVDFNASAIPSGIYFCRMVAGAYSKTIKLTVTK